MITVQFDSPGPAEPGEAISGKVLWQCPEDMKVNGVSIELEWGTEGRGDDDSCIVDAVAYKKTLEINQGRKLTFPFRLSIPASGPISYVGNLIRIQWTLHVTIERPWAVDLSHEEILQVAPRGTNQGTVILNAGSQ